MKYYFYHYHFSHFLPLHLNSERKSGKDLEMPKKCAIFVRRRKIEMIEQKRLMARTLSVPLLRGMTCWSGLNSSP